MIDKIILATNNPNKIKEYKDILGGLGIDVISQKEAGFDGDVEETGTTFAENAIIKAESTYKELKQAVIAEDGGIEIDYLGGKPGVYSHRFLRRRYTKYRKMCKSIRNDERC